MKILQTLRAHLFALVLATLLPGAILLGYSIYDETRHLVVEARNSLRTLVRIAAAGTSGFLATNRESMELFAKRPLVRALDGKRCDPVIYEFRDLFPRFANLTTITLDGIAVCSAVPQPGGKPVDVSKTEWFRRALAEPRFLAGNPFIGPITGRAVSVLVAPIRDEQNTLKGFVGLPLDLKLYAPSIGGTKLAPGMRMGIVSGDGYLVWRSEDPEKLIGKYVGDLPAVKALLATRDGNFEATGTDGVPRIYAVAPIPEAGWYAFVGIPSAQLYGRAANDAREKGIYGLLGLLASLLLAVVLARRIARPISRISVAARALREGDTAIRAPLQGPREVIEVAGEFNTMVDAWVKSAEQLKFLANHDVLTGLPNRMLLADRMMQAISRSKRDKRLVGVCFLDLDSFKPINDQYGHETGDHLLIEVGRRIDSSMRAGDTVARLGGDEFILILNELDTVMEIEQALARLQTVLTAPYRVGEREIEFSASIGVAIYPYDDSDPDTLLRHADHAMYVAKQLGKNQISFFDPEQESRVREWHQLRDEIRLGLQRDEFVLYYQPKVNMRDGEVIGAEALIRWQHPERGLVMPGQFLPAAEENQLIVDLGDWVLREAFRQIDAWRREGLNLRISVNIASRQLQEADFMHKVTDLLEEFPDVSPRLIEMEILESAALAELKSVSGIMSQCKDLGIDFALDDFGTGYSSLAYLKQLPAATLKIDQSFIRDMLEDPDSLAITEGILGLARAFQRDAIAEGVETLEHGIMLLQMGCDLGQGYGIARPMPASGVAAWAAGYRVDPRWIEAGAAEWSREDFPLFAMEAEHRRWVRRLVAWVESGDASAVPRHIENDQTCTFGCWYRAEGYAQYSHLAEFRAVGPLHREVHVLGGEMAEELRKGNLEAARARIDGVIAARDRMLAALRDLQAAVGAGHPARG
jgi:diguanylate cyclase (GGDEF)-like protein